MLVEAHHREHWRVSTYAHHMGLTSERLNRLTRGETGKSALALIHSRLAREASRRLLYTAAPIANLASDPRQFSSFAFTPEHRPDVVVRCSPPGSSYSRSIVQGEMLSATVS